MKKTINYNLGIKIPNGILSMQKALTNYHKVALITLNTLGPHLETITKIHQQLDFKLIETVAKQQDLINGIASKLNVFDFEMMCIISNLTIVSKAFEPVLKNLTTIEPNKFINKFIAEQNNIANILDTFSLRSVLLDEYWLVFEKDLISEIKEQMYENNYDVTKHIVAYYTKNKYEKIKYLLEYIKENGCKDDRFIILKDCFDIMIRNSCKKSCSVIIPTLTAQADGILQDIVFDEIPKDIRQQICTEKGCKDNSTAIITNCYLEKYSTVTFDTCDKFERVIKEKVFKKCDKKSTYQKSRQTVLHGGCSYPTKENLVRAWLEIAFLSKLYFEIRKTNLKNKNQLTSSPQN